MDLPKRKHPRLKTYDYSLTGHYYITIHIEKNAPLLSYIERENFLGQASVQLTATGKILQEQLYLLEQRFPYVKIDKYVIMPTHIHAIVAFGKETTGDSLRPTLTDVVCAYKSLATREVNRTNQTPGRKLFQISFYETVLRNEKAYQECWQYIDENPIKWLLYKDSI